MPRPENKLPTELEQELAETKTDLDLAAQIMPLMFDMDNMSILLALEKTATTGGLPFVSLGKATQLGTSQKLVDRLNLMIGYGFVEKPNGKYRLTEYGTSAADFAKKIVQLVNTDETLARKAGLKGHLQIIEETEQRIKALDREKQS